MFSSNSKQFLQTIAPGNRPNGKITYPSALPSRGEFLDGAESVDHRYLRLDYDPGQPGPMFKEPIPHVHVSAESAPRLALPRGAENDPVGWFIDFIYRNFFYVDWATWAEEAWFDYCSAIGRADNWTRLCDAFDAGQLETIEQGPPISE